ncbi:uncharacterized protein PHACADRAFT_249803, partial [Phanerochaete carnosa HHB-10118-sp]
METPGASIKRAPRTYGRRRELDGPDVDAALTAESSVSSNQSSPACYDSGRDVPPTSDCETSLVHGDDEDSEDMPDDSGYMLDPQNSLDWKRRHKTKGISEFDDDMEDAPPPRRLMNDSEGEPVESGSRPAHGIGADSDDAVGDEDVPRPRTLFRRSVREELARIHMEYDDAVAMGSHKGEALPLSADTPDDPFGVPPPVLRDTHTASPAHSPTSRFSRVENQEPTAHVSDSEGEGLPRSSP